MRVFSGVRSSILPCVNCHCAISPRSLIIRCSLKPKNHPIVPLPPKGFVSSRSLFVTHSNRSRINDRNSRAITQTTVVEKQIKFETDRFLTFHKCDCKRARPESVISTLCRSFGYRKPSSPLLFHAQTCHFAIWCVQFLANSKKKLTFVETTHSQITLCQLPLPLQRPQPPSNRIGSSSAARACGKNRRASSWQIVVFAHLCRSAPHHA